eukprot:Platyproteum_vivax@DN7799_c1_g1_i1.p1
MQRGWWHNVIRHGGGVPLMVLPRRAHIEPLTTPCKTNIMCILHTHRNISTLASNLRPGDIFQQKDKGKYCQVTEHRPGKKGRSVAMSLIDYIELDTQKTGHSNFNNTAKVDKITPERVQATFLYIEERTKKLVCADPDYDQFEIPANFVGPAANIVSSGDHLVVYKNQDDIVKVTLPGNVLAKLKKA